MSVDKITQFLLQPPEFLNLFGMVGNYYRWFKIEKKIAKSNALEDMISPDLQKSSFIDGLQQHVKLQKKALKE
eukprot:5078634-Ditylum_brightwellii.AAC.1